MYRPLRSPPRTRDRNDIYLTNTSYICLSIKFAIGLSISAVIIVSYYSRLIS